MTKKVLRGDAHVFGDNINTDLISPARYMEKSAEVIAAHAMEGADPGFSSRVKQGDFVVAGRNFGSGSSRETAPIALKGCGVAAVIAVFFARIFYRNCINIGLPVFICPQADRIAQGDTLEIETEAGIIRNLTTGEAYACDPLPPNIRKIIDCGGLLESLNQP